MTRKSTERIERQRQLVYNILNDLNERGKVRKRFAKAIRVVSSVSRASVSGGGNQSTPILRQMFSLFISLLVLSTVFISPVAATWNTENQKSELSGNEFLRSNPIDALGRVSDNECTSGSGSGSNGNGTSTTTSTTTKTSDQSTTGTTHSTTTKTSTETPHESESETTVPKSGALPDLNSPMIALVGVLCVIGGLVAITRR
ncbi:hypothetical protein [Haladaptatus sp. DFWS20]|uniref:hypothetical protein n=1 Tax=Haladaptatus sp. DFWS20 TaxID=3403467 RepID=UPI003EBD35C1